MKQRGKKYAFRILLQNLLILFIISPLIAGALELIAPGHGQPGFGQGFLLYQAITFVPTMIAIIVIYSKQKKEEQGVAFSKT